MARVTVEDCIKKIPNRFELVLLAGKRARQLAYGALTSIESNDDKNPVIALREIAEDKLDLEALHEEMVKHHQKHAFYEGDDEETDEEIVELMAGEAEWVPQEPVSEENVAEGISVECPEESMDALVSKTVSEEEVISEEVIAE